MEKRYSYCKFTIEEEKLIIADYKNGLSMIAVGRKWKCDPTTVKNILKAYGEESRTLSQAHRNYLDYQINETCFERITTPE